MKNFLKQIRDDVSGNALMIFAGALVPMLMTIGTAVDLSVAYMAKAKLQNACDAAALAGRQIMQGTNFDNSVKQEANKFFNFNFPEGTLGTEDLVFRISQDQDLAQINGSASVTVPTPLMSIFGFDEADVSVACDATRDFGNNDVMLVLDVTGSMLEPPSAIGGISKIERLRKGAMGLYRALDDTLAGATTRYGIVPYSHTVNVGRMLNDRDIIDRQLYVDGTWRFTDCKRPYSNWYCETVVQENKPPPAGYYNGDRGYRYAAEFIPGEKRFAANISKWRSKSAFRTSGDGCIEERSSIGNGDTPIRIGNSVSTNDIDLRARTDNDTERQFGRYDSARTDSSRHENDGSATSGGTAFWNIGNRWIQTGCPSEATHFLTYGSENDFKTAINNATARVTGGTYHDIGMLWGARLISRTGFFASLNPEERNNFPVDQHIVFMTDGALDTGETLYSAFGIQALQNRMRGSGTLDDIHISRFQSICNIVRARGVTVWVIALDEDNTDDIARCATSPAHFWTSDGSDLEQVFETIGRGIGNLRLTR
ncbi:hypothetical protein E3U23_08435 [Erythrobacter litoralis]|uniref:TadE/TadG family type IV pilus assembly protein n=1 Tax=Erythrobacter litoralis TaxID=39960 RepID=UPI002435AA25|nr:Tad domain-containing protein [Erythrobacter litoralis]MDG6079219.1 hypothetical protein [Erythrobacter litoralis]